VIKGFHPSTTIVDVISHLAAPDKHDYTGFAVVRTEDNTIVGICTLRDLSKKLVDDMSIALDEVGKYCIKEFVAVETDDAGSLNVCKARAMLHSHSSLVGKVRYVPVVNSENQVVAIREYDEIFKTTDTYRIALYGLGFVGLTLFAASSSVGYESLGIDVDEEKIKLLSSSSIYVSERGLADVFRNQHLSERVSSVSEDGKNYNVKIICVGTTLDSSGDLDQGPLQSACLSIGETLQMGDLVVLRSTVPVGMTRRLIALMEERSRLLAGTHFHVAFCPERTVEGNALKEVQVLPQVIGGLTRRCADIAHDVFREICESTVICDSLEEAELIKLVNNSFRDLTFAFSNELVMVADQYNLDVSVLVERANFNYPRDRIPTPSPGVGGYCLTKDPYIYAMAHEKKDISLSKLARAKNDAMLDYSVHKFLAHCDFHSLEVDSLKVGVFGMAFKGVPETNDLRYSSGVHTAQKLMALGARVVVWDPIVTSAELGEEFSVFDQSLADLDAVFLMNNHPSLLQMDWRALSSKNKKFLLFDGWHHTARNIIPVDILSMITVCSLGRKN
jgi:nucleotide sugar dehydrogenase